MMPLPVEAVVGAVASPVEADFHVVVPLQAAAFRPARDDPAR